MTLALTATATSGVSAVVETLRGRALPSAPANVPNVLLIVLDTLRADHLSSYGYERSTTPNLDRIARDGVLFERAFAPSSWTLPSHASLFTGRYVHEHLADAGSPGLGPDYATLAEVLAARGFVTGGFSANTVWANRNVGFARGFLHFEDYFHAPSDAFARTVLGREVVARIVSYLGERNPLGRKRAREVSDEFTTWLDGVHERPFFAFLNYIDAHSPYASPIPYHTQFMTERQRAVQQGFSFNPPLVAKYASTGEQPLFTAAYDGAIAYLDSEIDRLLEELRRRGQLDRTLIVITADHGEALGDHGFYNHGHSLYIDQIHVPLIARLPGTIPSALRITHPISTADIPATILALEGLPNVEFMPGVSLGRFWEHPSPEGEGDSWAILSEVGQRDGLPTQWLVSTGWVRSLVTEGYHFIERQNGKVELYRLADDPRETLDLAGTEEGQPLVEIFRSRLDQMVTEPRTAAPLGKAAR